MNGLFPIFRINKNGNRPVIDQFHIHHGSKFAALHFSARHLGEMFQKQLIQRNGYFRAGGTDETRTVALLGHGVQGKLTDHQKKNLQFG